MRLNTFLITLSLFLSLTPAQGQKSSFVFHHLSIKDGLSESTVRCIAEDTKGFMWFGTEDGVNKYDGYKFSIYKNNPKDNYSISSSILRSFYSDRKGNLWMGSRHGLNLYDHQLDRFYNYNSNDYPALKNLRGQIEGITEDNLGNLWVIEGTEGLCKITSLDKEPQKFSFSHFQNISFLTNIAVDRKNNCWVGTTDGILKFDLKANKFIDLRPVFGKGYHVRKIHIDPNQNVWLSTTQGLKCIEFQTGKLKEYMHDPRNPQSLNGNNVLQVIPYEDKFLIAIDGDGIDLFDPKKETFDHYTVESGSQLSSNNITSLYKDTRGTLWAGTFMNGMNFSNITTNFFVYVKNNASSLQEIMKGVVTCFLKDRNQNLWISTDGGGLFLKKKGADSFIQFDAAEPNPEISSNAVIGLIENEGEIWISTYGGGLVRLNYPGKSKSYRHDNKNPNSLRSDKLLAVCDFQNEIWVSTHGLGVSVLDKNTEEFRHYHHDPKNPNSIPSDWVHKFYKDKNGTLWLATFNGLAKYIPETRTFKNFYFNNDQGAFTKNFIYELFEDSHNNFWLGSNGGGLILFDREKQTFQAFTTEDGLSHNCVKSIMEDAKEHLWLASNNSISKFSLLTKKAIPYTINEGLPPCSFFPHSKFKDENNKIYFGSNDGYLIIDPKLSIEESSYPNVVLTDLQIFNVPVRPGANSLLTQHINEAKQITLPYFQNSLSFEFAALNFNIPKRNSYAYKLEGFEEGWNVSGKNRLAIYTNLNPGNYIFKVKASNNSKLWGEEETSFIIRITPPFYQTWWFKILMGAVFLLMILAFIYVRTQNIRNNNQWLKDQVMERTRELKETNLILAEQHHRVVDQSEKILEQQRELLDKKYELEKNNEELAEWNEFQKRLIGILGHDLRGPLQHFSMLLKYQSEDSSEWVNSKLKETAGSLSMLATDMLGWITMQSQKGAAQYSSFTWKDVMDKALQDIESARAEKKVVFCVKHTENQSIKGVYPIVLSSLRNILFNAIRFSKENGVVEVESGIRKNGFSGIRVTDHGIGFDAPQVNKLIQGDAFKGMKESSLKEGAGLGMAICYDMVKRTGGWIEADSLPESGATFYVFMPEAKEGEVKPNEKAAPAKKEIILDRSKLEVLKGKKLLLVDDDDELRWPIVKLLSNYVEVQEVRSAEEALVWLKNHTPDMAVLDIRMPGESGLELCHKIKNSAETAHVPCTVISGEVGENIRTQVYEAGADAFLTKPFGTDELLLHISSYFENQTKKLRRYFHEGSTIDQITQNPINKEFLSHLVKLVEENLSSGELNVDFLAGELGLSRASLYRKLKSLTGQTVNDFIKDIRMRKSLHLLKAGHLNISEVAHEVGFNSLSYFTTSFKKHFGYSPTELKK